MQQILQVQSTANRMLRTANRFQTQMQSVQRLMTVNKIPAEVAGGDEVGDDWPPNGHIVFTDVELRYRPKTEIVL